MKTRSFLTRAREALSQGSSVREKLRLCHYAAVKPSLVHRGLARYQPERILAFSPKTRTRHPLQVHVRDNGVGIVTIGEFFSAQSQIMPRDLPPLQPRVIYDLGANLGVASMFFNSLYPEAQIYGFEPLPENLEVCVRNYQQLPPPSKVFPWAVGGETGTAIFDCQNDSRGGRLESSPHDPRLATVGKMEVQLYSIRDLIDKVGLPVPDLIKIDVEGAECDVLRGLEQHYTGVKWIYLETHGAVLEAWCRDWLLKRDFKILACAHETCFWATRESQT